MTQSIKAGTRVEFLVSHPMGRNEMAVVARWTKVNGEIKNQVCGKPGWHIIKFSDGGNLCVHEDSFRVIDNRAA